MKKKLYALPLVYLLVLLAFVGIAAAGSQAVTVIAQNRPVERLHRIVIDAGHGGEDGGAVSCTGVPESGINLEISLRLDDLFHLLGYDTVMVRTTDISVYTEGSTLAQKKASDLKNRVKLVNETENSVLLSIHQNIYSESKYYGAQVFYAGSSSSEELAKQLQAAFVSTVNPGSIRQAKKASGLYLMEHITRPGVLIECGFLTNPEEEAKLRTPEYQKKLCCVIAATVSTYFSAA